MKKPKIHISFLGNAYHDSRMVNLYRSLKEEGHEVTITSFDWHKIKKSDKEGDIKIYKISKKISSIFFYLKFAAIVKLHLLKSNADIFIAEDVFCLPFVVWFGKLKRKKVYYNSRELYPFLAGLRNKKRNQSTIAKIEKMFIRHVDKVMVTGEMDAEFIMDYYKLNNVVVIRNLPSYRKPEEPVDFRALNGLGQETTILLYQGVILEGRGLELLLKAIKQLDNIFLVVLGDGPFREHYIEMAKKEGVSGKTSFTGMVPHEKLINFTAGADIGFSLIENISKSYYYALPNKLFEYIMAGVPVVVSKLPQMEKIARDYSAGEVIDLDKDNLVEKINGMIADREKLAEYKQNCEKASKELNWEKEFDKVKEELFGDK